MKRNEIAERIFPVWFDNKPLSHVAVSMPIMARVLDNPEFRAAEGMVLLPQNSGIMRLLFARNNPDPTFLAIALELTGYTEQELLAFTSEVEGDAHFINAPGIENIPFTI